MDKNDIKTIKEIKYGLDDSISKLTKQIEEANFEYNYKLSMLGYSYYDSLDYGIRMYYKTNDIEFVNGHALVYLFDVNGNNYSSIVKQRKNNTIIFCDVESEYKNNSRRYVNNSKKQVINREMYLTNKNERNGFTKREHAILDHVFKFSITEFCEDNTLRQKQLTTINGKDIWKNTPYAKELRRTEELNHLRNLRRKALEPVAKSKEEKEIIMRRHM